MNVPDYPSPWPAILLALAVFRLTRLAGWDDLTIRIRRSITGMSDQGHHQFAEQVDHLRQQGLDPWDCESVTAAIIDQRAREGNPVRVGEVVDWKVAIGSTRFYLSKMIRCPWCIGFWISLAVWAAWLVVPSVVVGLSVPLAFSATTGLIAKNLDP
jgi:hypothetical protein